SRRTGVAIRPNALDRGDLRVLRRRRDLEDLQRRLVALLEGVHAHLYEMTGLGPALLLVGGLGDPLREPPRFDPAQHALEHRPRPHGLDLIEEDPGLSLELI